MADAYAQRRTHRANGHVLVIGGSTGCPYKDHLRAIESEAGAQEPAVLYVVAWDRGRKQWSAVAVEETPGSFDNRLPFPPQWRSLRDQPLCDATGIPNSKFVHATGFCAANLQLEDLLRMIDKSIELQPDAYAKYRKDAPPSSS